MRLDENWTHLFLHISPREICKSSYGMRFCVKPLTARSVQFYGEEVWKWNKHYAKCAQN